jgi:hypothetical protein
MASRTLQQNKSLHKWLEQLAEVFDGAGIDMRTLIKIPIRPNKDNIKTEIVHPVMKAINPELESTADMSTTEMIELYETLNRAFAESEKTKHITIPPWPSMESMRYEKQEITR